MKHKYMGLALMTALVAIGASPACGAEVVSKNVVGYKKLTLTAEAFKMTGIQFVNVGNEYGTLADLFAGTDIPYGTQLRFVNAAGSYDYISYLEEAYDENTKDFVPGWADEDEYLVSDIKTTGTGFWVKAPANYNLVQAGQVQETASDSVTINLDANVFAMVINPFPAPFNPNEVTWTDLPYGAQIRVPNASGSYDYYNYMEEAYDENTKDFLPGWADEDEYLVTGPIAEVGEGFWIRTSSAASVTFTSPLAN